MWYVWSGEWKNCNSLWYFCGSFRRIWTYRQYNTYLIGLLNFGEFLSVAPLVRVVLHGKLPVGVLNFLFRGILAHAQNVVKFCIAPSSSHAPAAIPEKVVERCSMDVDVLWGRICDVFGATSTATQHTCFGQTREKGCKASGADLFY